MDDCLFCKIIRGEIPCARVFESSGCLAFLDIAPVNEGHALVVPKAHYPTLFDIPGDLGQELLEAMQRVGRAVMDATSADGLNIGMNNYQAAGQLVPHAHFHLIPRFATDGLTLWPQRPYSDPDGMTRLAASIQQLLTT